MNDIKQIPLESFKKDKRQVFVDFVNGIVRWKKRKYDLTYINVGGKHYPYVVLRNIIPLSKLESKINTVCTQKDDLKWTEYQVKDDYYYVSGIGPEAIKASKNGEPEEYYRYEEEEGQKLLQELMNFTGQSVL